LTDQLNDPVVLCGCDKLSGIVLVLITSVHAPSLTFSGSLSTAQLAGKTERKTRDAIALMLLLALLDALTIVRANSSSLAAKCVVGDLEAVAEAVAVAVGDSEAVGVATLD
jgi:hypothetical protein